ncbi:D-alanyl-D-alanine carboxypeptidase, partial [Rhodococcus sp. CSLK01-03]|nr:D-alanyl-D-alanine carboxypeptidase [Rhodococcus indonesiensis]
MLAGQGKKKLGTLAGRRRRNLRILFTIWAAGTVALLVGGAFALSDFRSGEAAAAIAPAPAPVTATPQVAP